MPKRGRMLWGLSWGGFSALPSPWLLFGDGLGFPSLRVFVPGNAWKRHLLLRHSSAGTHGAFNSSGRSPEIPVPAGDEPRARGNGAGRALSSCFDAGLKRTGWTVPFQQPPAAKREVPGAEPSGVTLAGRGRTTWSWVGFLFTLPKSKSLQHHSPSRYPLGVRHPCSFFPQDILPGVQQPHSVIA